MGENKPVSVVYEAEGKRVGEVEGCDDASFMPDGRLIVTGRGFGPGLFIADVASGKKTPINFDGGKEGGEPPVTAEAPRTPVVSPDGKRVAYCDGRDVYVVGVDGRGWTPVWRNPKHEPQHRPAFSPDGRYLAIINVPLNVMNGPGQVLVFDLERQLMQAVGGPADANSDAPLGWAP
jgi:Tol biopolymer transport system component